VPTFNKEKDKIKGPVGGSRPLEKNGIKEEEERRGSRGEKGDTEDSRRKTMWGLKEKEKNEVKPSRQIWTRGRKKDGSERTHTA